MMSICGTGRKACFFFRESLFLFQVKQAFLSVCFSGKTGSKAYFLPVSFSGKTGMMPVPQ
jgi:hypothetical protein